MWIFKSARAKRAAVQSPAINQFDLAFVVDTTGSMGWLIADAQRYMIGMIDRLKSTTNVDLQLGIVEYRDHPPQDTLVTRVYPLTGELAQVKKSIGKLRAQGGGDEPEAVLAGVVASCRELNWRTHARRIVVLVGDAPPHGVGCPGDAFRRCPSGETVETTSAKCEEAKLTVYAIALTKSCQQAFTQLSRLTGGDCFSTHSAIEQIQKLLTQEFGQLEFDRQVHDAWLAAAGPAIDSVADQIESTPPRVASAVSRLRSRGFLKSPAVMREVMQ